MRLRLVLHCRSFVYELCSDSVLLTRKVHAMTDKSFYYTLVAIVLISGLISKASVLIAGVAA